MKGILKLQEPVLKCEIGGLCVSFADANEERSEESPRQHSHSAFELQHVIEGSMLLKSNSFDATVKKGQFVLIPPNFFHRTEPSPDMRKYAVLFSVSPISEEVDFFHPFDSLETPFISSSSDVDYCVGKVSLALARCEESYKLKHYLSGLFIAVSELVDKRDEKETLPLADHRRPKKESLEIRGVIDDAVTLCYAKEDLLGKIADTIHMSRRNTSRIVNKLFSCPLSVLVARQRMNCAMSFIKDTDMPLSDISAEVGYNTYSAFYKAFRKYYGKSPEEYRV